MSVTTLGFREFQRKLNTLGGLIREEADGYVLDAAQEWQHRAVLDAPVDTGKLKQGIKSRKAGEMSAEVFSLMEYSPYVEWGTGSRVKVPADLQAYAIQFKRGNRTIGRFPHPYFFVQRPVVEKHLIDNLKKIISTPR